MLSAFNFFPFSKHIFGADFFHTFEGVTDFFWSSPPICSTLPGITTLVDLSICKGIPLVKYDGKLPFLEFVVGLGHFKLIRSKAPGGSTQGAANLHQIEALGDWCWMSEVETHATNHEKDKDDDNSNSNSNNTSNAWWMWCSKMWRNQ